MKTNILGRAVGIFSLLMLVAALFVPGASAGARGTAVFRIPFDFVVAGKTLPAGRYVVTRSTLASDEIVSLRGVDKNDGAYALTMTMQANKIQDDTKLVFNRYQDQYFLSEFWTSGTTNGRQLIKSGRERELAQAGTKAEQVAVLLQK